VRDQQPPDHQGDAGDKVDTDVTQGSDPAPAPEGDPSGRPSTGEVSGTSGRVSVYRAR